MLNVRLAGDHLYGNCCSPGCRLWCLWWCLFVLSFFPRGVLDEILNLIESVSEGFPSYFYFLKMKHLSRHRAHDIWMTLYWYRYVMTTPRHHYYTSAPPCACYIRNTENLAWQIEKICISCIRVGFWSKDIKKAKNNKSQHTYLLNT